MVIAERRYLERTEHGVVIRPDNSLGDGHLVVAPLTHLQSFAKNPVIAAQVMRLAAMKAKEPCSVLWQLGSEAGQLMPHIYCHIIPAALAEVKATPYARRNSSGAARRSRDSDS
jgi:diadenosine tetraphosphate (Ap4A) HIT family hydrolase